MGKGRMKEVGEWYRFLEVLVSWLALIDEAYVSEMRRCLKHPNVIEQAKLQSPVAARSAKLFYYLGQCLAKEAPFQMRASKEAHGRKTSGR